MSRAQCLLSIFLLHCQQKLGLGRRRAASDRAKVPVVEVGRIGLGRWGAWTGLPPDDSPLTLRDVGIDEIYALDWEEP